MNTTTVAKVNTEHTTLEDLAYQAIQERDYAAAYAYADRIAAQGRESDRASAARIGEAAYCHEHDC